MIFYLNTETQSHRVFSLSFHQSLCLSVSLFHFYQVISFFSESGHKGTNNLPNIIHLSHKFFQLFPSMPRAFRHKPISSPHRFREVHNAEGVPDHRQGIEPRRGGIPAIGLTVAFVASCRDSTLWGSMPCLCSAIPSGFPFRRERGAPMGGEGGGAPGGMAALPAGRTAAFP